MRYTERLKDSLCYHWRVIGKCLKILVGLQFWVVGFLVVFSVIPRMVEMTTPETSLYLKWYFRTPAPTFELNLSQELASTDYYWKLRDDIPLLLEFNYFWVKSSDFWTLSIALFVASLGLLTVAYLREGIPARDKEE